MKLKLYQKKLLYLLAINSRYTNKDLSKVLKVSEDTINYNKTEMQKRKLFEYSIFFDYRKLGWGIYHMLLKIGNCENINFEKLKEIEDITYINTFLGKYDLHINFVAENEEMKNKKIEQIKKVLGKNNIKEQNIVKYFLEVKLTHILPEFNLKVQKPKNSKNKIYNLNQESFMAEEYITKLHLNKIDIKIIQTLLNNPQTNYLEISKKTKISRDTIRNRINKYIEENFLVHFGIFPNLKKFGYFTYCLYLKLNKINIEKIRKFSLEKKFIFYTECCEGEKNLFIYIWAKSPEDFSNYYKETLSFLSNNLINIDLLIFDNLIHQKEFPTSLIK